MLCAQDSGIAGITRHEAPSFSSALFSKLPASFLRFGCFVLRSSFSSASFSKLPKYIVQI